MEVPFGINNECEILGILAEMSWEAFSARLLATPIKRDGVRNPVKHPLRPRVTAHAELQIPFRRIFVAETVRGWSQ